MTVSHDTYTLILDRAGDLFLSQGYHKTSMRAIAQAAGISTGPLYFHFRSKAEVFFHILNRVYDRLLADFRRATEEDIHAGLRLRNIFHAYITFYRREPQLFEIIHLPANPLAGIELPEDLQEVLAGRTDELILLMDQVIRQGITAGELRPVDSRRLALYLYSAAEGVFLADRSGVLARSQVEFDAMIESVIDLIGVGMINLGKTPSGPHLP